MKEISYQLGVLILFICLLSIDLTAQTPIPGGTVSGNWTIMESPYLIEGDITITDDSTLIIEPGVIVEFQGHYKLNVHGVLLAVGTETDTILFTINDTTGFSNVDTTLGGWNGINFRAVLPQNDTSRITFAKIEYCKNVSPIWPDDSGGAILIEHSNKVLISNSVFNSNFAHWGGAIRIVYSEIIISDCIFSNNHSSSYGGALASDFSTIHFDRCNFIQNISDFNSGAINAWKCDLNINRSDFISNHSTTNYGAIGADSSNVIINNSLFESNSTIWGGGLSVNYGTLELTNSSFKNNYADHGGGLISGWSNNYLSNVVFEQNGAVWGGGMSITNCNMDATDLLFTNNQANEGAAFEYLLDTLSFDDVYDVNFTKCDFIENTALNFAGGIRFEQYNSESSLANIYLENCSFIRNHADHVTAVRILGNIKNFRISNSIFDGNTSARWAASTTFRDGCEGIVSNCLYINNTASLNGASAGPGGPGIAGEAHADFINCTFANNSAGYGSAFNVRDSATANIMNSIFWNNSKDQIALTTRNAGGSSVSLNYCLIQDGLDSIKTDSATYVIWGSGNISSDPFFIDENNDDYNLMDNSPCIGAGVDSLLISGSWYLSPQFDIEGNLRPTPVNTNPDIGAYESPLSIPVSVERDVNQFPNTFKLFQNYPNPFNSSTIIKYSIPAQSVIPNSFRDLSSQIPDQVRNDNIIVKLIVYDILGREVITLVDEKQKPGYYEVEWNANDQPSGVYFYKRNAGDSAGPATKTFVMTKKMILLR